MENIEDKLSTKITEIIKLVDSKSQETATFYKEIKRELKEVKKKVNRLRHLKVIGKKRVIEHQVGLQTK